MIYSTILALIVVSVIITAEPGPPINTDPYAPQPPSPYNYYEYRSQQQQPTPSPYTAKRNQNSNNYADQQQQQQQSSSIAAAYGNAQKKTSANQCKLHINCPSK
jgi:hypothetical protein